MNTSIDRRELLAAVTGAALVSLGGHRAVSAAGGKDRGSYSRTFETDDIRYEGGLIYLFTAMLAPSRSVAEDAYQNMIDALSDSEGGVIFDDIEDVILVDFAERSGPDLGDDSTAFVITITDTSYSFTAEVIMAFCQKGRIVHAIAGLGLDSVRSELFDIAEDSLTFTATDTVKLKRSVPTLADLPRGFYVSEEGYEDSDDGLPRLPGSSAFVSRAVARVGGLS